ncbi:MAG: hypothetical protein ACREEW_09850 [Caulobacteraceae bacterium]
MSATRSAGAGRLIAPIALGLAAGTAAFIGYRFSTHHAAQQQALAAAAGDPDMAKPSAAECAVAEAAASAVHVAGEDRRWEASAGVKTVSLGAHSRVINPADVDGYTDAEADDLRSKGIADWRWCPGMSKFAVSLGWSPMGVDDGVAELGIGRPGVNRAGDEAVVYEDFAAATGPSDALLLTAGPWLATLHRGADGAWKVISTKALKRPHG